MNTSHDIQNLVDEVKTKLSSEEYLKFCNLLKERHEEESQNILCELIYVKPRIVKVDPEKNEGCCDFWMDSSFTKILTKITKKGYEDINNGINEKGYHRHFLDSNHKDSPTHIKTKQFYDLNIENENETEYSAYVEWVNIISLKMMN